MKKWSLILLMVALCMLIGLYYGCDNDDNGAGPEPTNTPTPSTLPSATPTNTPTQIPDKINGCWDFTGSLTTCTGEPPDTCELICSLLPEVTGQAQFEKRANNKVYVCIQALGEEPVCGEGDFDGTNITYTGTIQVPGFNIMVDLSINSTFDEANLTITGTISAHAYGDFGGTPIDCNATGAFNATKKSNDPCVWE